MISLRATPQVRPPRQSIGAVFADPALRIALTYFVAAQLLDIFTTLMGTVSGLSEMNPVTAGVLLRFGGFGLLVQKLPTVLAVMAAVTALPRRQAILAAWGFTVLTATVVASNVGLILSSH